MRNLGARLREVRIRSGLTVRELAHRANISPSFVSQIENGKSRPSVATLYTFSRLMRVSVDDLFDVEADDALRDPPPGAGRAIADRPADTGARADAARDPASIWRTSEYANRVSIVHPAHRSRLPMSAGVLWERLAATPECEVNFMQISYAPGASSTDTGEMSSHAGYEYGYVLQGSLEVTIGGERFTLHGGESLGFDSSIPHSFRNPGSQPMRGVWFVHGAG